MSVNTPQQTKRRISNLSTPSPSIRRDSKSIRMETPQNTSEEMEDPGTNTIQDKV